MDEAHGLQARMEAIEGVYQSCKSILDHAARSYAPRVINHPSINKAMNNLDIHARQALMKYIYADQPA